MSDEKPHLRIHKWDDLQHYKDREPPWIKLYNRLLDHYEFGRLPDAVKGHYMGLLMLRSRHGEPLPLDVDWLASRINATEPLDLRPLVSAGLIEVYHDDSTMLYQYDSGAEAFTRSREAEAETEAEESADGSSLRSSPSEPSGSLEHAPEETDGEGWHGRVADSLRTHAYPDGEPESGWTVARDLDIAEELLDEGYSVEHLEDAIEAVRLMAEHRHPSVRDWIGPGDQFTLRVLRRRSERGQKLVQVAPNYLYKHEGVAETAEAVTG